MSHAPGKPCLCFLVLSIALVFPAAAQVGPSAASESFAALAPALGAQADAKAFIPLGESARYFKPGFGASVGGFSFIGKSLGLRSSILVDWIYLADQGSGGISLFSLTGRVGLPIRLFAILAVDPGFRFGWYYGEAPRLGAADYGALLGFDLSLSLPVYKNIAAELRLGYGNYLALADGLEIDLGFKWRSEHEQNP
jgi:hypothetical protein